MRHTALALLAFVIAGCRSAGTGTGPSGSISLSLNPTGASVAQGGQTTVTGTLTRSGGFTGTVDLTVTNAPSGVSATVGNIQTSGAATTATITVVVSLAAPVGGPTTLTVHGTGTGVSEATATFALTVTAAPNFALGITPAGAVTLQQGNLDNSKTITIARTNYGGTITLAAEGLPTGVTAAFAGNPMSGNSSLMTLTATAGATVGGPTTVTVRGTGPASLRGPGDIVSLEATTTFSLSVTAAAPLNNVTLDFTGCNAGFVPSKLFVQDGNGAWVKITGNNSVYAFNITQPKAGIIRVTPGGGGTVVDVEYLTQAELTGVNPYRFCQPVPTRITVNTTVQNAGAANFVAVSMGNWTNFSVGNGPIQVSPTPPGPFDLVAYTLGSPDHFVLIPGLNPTDNGTVGPVDFGSNSAIGAGTLTVSGIQGGETVGHAMSYHTGSACYTAVLYSGEPAGASTFMRGAPNNITSAHPDHFHEVTIYTSATGMARSFTRSFHTMANGAVTLGPNLGAPAITVLPGNYKRLQAVFVLPPEYHTSASFNYFASGSPVRSVVIGASYGVLGGAGSQTLAFPDMQGVTGWDDADMPGTSRTGGQNVTVTQIAAGSRCVEGWTMLTAVRTGSF